MKGQITVVSLIVLFIVIIIFAALLPMLNNTINASAASLDANPNDGTDLTKSVLFLLPFAIAAAIALTAFNYSIPKREGM